MLIFVYVIFFATLLYVLFTYNKFVTLKARIKASIQEIGNQLKRQADLIPNIVEQYKDYKGFEKGIFKDLTEARKTVLETAMKGDSVSMINASDSLQKMLGQIKVVVESNPQLTSIQASNKVMEEIRDTLDKIMYSRRVLIDLSADYNIMLVTFPSNLVAKLANFKAEKGLVTPEEGAHLEVGVEEMKTPKIKHD